MISNGNVQCFGLTCFAFHFRYVHNDIFFSFAVDADIWQMSKENESSVMSTFGHDAKHSAATESLPDLLEKAVNSARTGYDSSEHKSEVSNKEELSSVASVISDVASEALMADSEQATYASANNDLKGIKAYQEADIPGIYNPAMAIIDYRGHRVVAQVHSRILNPLIMFLLLVYFLGKHLATIFCVVAYSMYDC